MAAAPEVLRTCRSAPDRLRYIGGVIPSRPTTTTVASHVPSPCFSQRGMNTCAPVLRSSLPPATRFAMASFFQRTARRDRYGAGDRRFAEWACRWRDCRSFRLQRGISHPRHRCLCGRHRLLPSDARNRRTGNYRTGNGIAEVLSPFLIDAFCRGQGDEAIQDFWHQFLDCFA